MTARKFVFYFFVVVNFLSFLYFYFGGVSSKPINNAYDAERVLYVLSFLLLFLSLYVIVKLYDIIDFYTAVKPASINIHSIGRKRQDIVGFVILLLQIYYLLYVIVFGGYVAGAESKLGGDFSGALIAITQIQTLQIIYIASIPNYKSYIWWLVLIMYVITSILQGWSSVYLVLSVMYLFYLFNNGKIKSFKKISLIAFSLVFFLYPIIYYFRLTTRIAGKSGVSFYDVPLFKILQVDSIFEYCTYSYMMIMDRFQQFYFSLGFLVNRNKILDPDNIVNIIPYYVEGPQKAFLLGTLDIENAFSMGNYLPSIFFNDAVLGEYFWNISPGIVSYFFLDPFLSIFIITYFYLIIFVIVLFMKSIRPSRVFFDMFYYYTIVLLFAGWVSQFMYFLWSIVIFYLLVIMTGIFIPVRQRGNGLIFCRSIEK